MVTQRMRVYIEMGTIEESMPDMIIFQTNQRVNAQTH